MSPRGELASSWEGDALASLEALSGVEDARQAQALRALLMEQLRGCLRAQLDPCEGPARQAAATWTDSAQVQELRYRLARRDLARGQPRRGRQALEALAREPTLWGSAAAQALKELEAAPQRRAPGAASR